MHTTTLFTTLLLTLTTTTLATPLHPRQVNSIDEFDPSSPGAPDSSLNAPPTWEVTCTDPTQTTPCQGLLPYCGIGTAGTTSDSDITGGLSDQCQSCRCHQKQDEAATPVEGVPAQPVPAKFTPLVPPPGATPSLAVGVPNAVAPDGEDCHVWNGRLASNPFFKAEMGGKFVEPCN